MKARYQKLFLKNLLTIVSLITVNSSLSNAMEAEQPRKTEREKRRCGRDFIDALDRDNPQISDKYNTRVKRVRDDKILFNIKAGGSALVLSKLEINKLPKEIVNLKGCITKLFLDKNPDLNMEGLPIEITTLGEDFSMDVQGTPLEKIFGKPIITPKDILEKKNVQSGTISNLALAPKSEDPNFAAGSPFEELPRELRQKILENMAKKTAEERN